MGRSSPIQEEVRAVMTGTKAGIETRRHDCVPLTGRLTLINTSESMATSLSTHNYLA